MLRSCHIAKHCQKSNGLFWPVELQAVTWSHFKAASLSVLLALNFTEFENIEVR